MIDGSKVVRGLSLALCLLVGLVFVPVATAAPSLSFVVSSKLKPKVASYTENGVVYKVGHLKDSYGTDVDVVEGQIIVAASPSKIAAILKRLGATRIGTVQLHGPDLPGGGAPATTECVLARVPTASFSFKPTTAASNLRTLAPLAQGTLTFSDVNVEKLVAITAHEAAAFHTKVALNVLHEPASILSGSAQEASFEPGGLEPDSFTWPSHKVGGPLNIGTTYAWQAMEIAGKTSSQVNVLVGDYGFNPSSDTPISVVPIEKSGVASGNTAAPWHGTQVASVIGAQIDSGDGTAGTGGQVANLIGYSSSLSLWSMTKQMMFAQTHNTPIINWSFFSYCSFVTCPVYNLVADTITEIAHKTGILLVASAGNEGTNIDAQICFGLVIKNCVQKYHSVPCSLDFVTCVGAVAANGDRLPSSNWGTGQRSINNGGLNGSHSGSVDIYAPGCVPTSADPPNAGMLDLTYNNFRCGSSTAAAYVSGIAAMEVAAHPGSTPTWLESNLIETSRSLSHRVLDDALLVNAKRAVLTALGPQAPVVTIQAPWPGATVGPDPQTFTLAAKVDDVQDGAHCCAGSIDWYADGNFLGRGSPLVVSFAGVGTHRIVASYKNSVNLTSSAAVNLIVDAGRPQISIIKPGWDDTVPLNTPVNLVANTGFPGNTFKTITCTWTSTAGDAQFPSSGNHGCTSLYKFTSVGMRQLTVTGTDQFQNTAISKVWVDVQAPDPDYPLVSLTAPGASGTVDVGDSVYVDGFGVGGTGHLNYVWSWQPDSCPTVSMALSGPSFNFSWMGPAASIWDTAGLTGSCQNGPGVLKLTVTDANGHSGNDSIHFKLWTPFIQN